MRGRAVAMLEGAMLTIAVLLPAPSASAAGWWDAPRVLPATGPPEHRPAVAVGPDKDVVMLWRDGRIHRAERPPGGDFAVAPPLGDGTPDESIGIDLAIHSDGTVLAVWGQGGVVHGAVREAGAWRELGALTQANVRAARVAFLPDGTALLVYIRDEVVRAATRPPGASFGNDVPIYITPASDNMGHDLVLDVGPGGHAGVLFTMTSSSGSTTIHRLRSLQRAPGGVFGSLKDVDSASSTSNDDSGTIYSFRFREPQLSVDAAGNARAGYVKSTHIDYNVNSQDDDETLHAAIRPEGANAWGAQKLDEGKASSSQPYPLRGLGLELTAAGEAVLSWARTPDQPDPPAGYRASVSAPGAGLFGNAAEVAASDGPAPGFGARLVDIGPSGTLLVYEAAGGIRSRLRPPGGSFGDERSVVGAIDGPSDLVLASDGVGDAVALLRPSGSDVEYRATVYDGSPPVLTALDVPPAGRPGESLAMSSAAFDAFNPVTLGWAFGDGADAAGGQVAHAFTAAGTFPVSATATDAAGNAATATRPVSIAAPPPPPPPPAERPVVSAFSVSPKRFAPRRSARLRYTVSAPGTARITIARARAGRRSGRRCVAPARRLRRARRCTRYTRVALVTRPVDAGMNSARLTVRIGRKRLRPGTYRATIVVSAPGMRLPSLPRHVRFRVARR